MARSSANCADMSRGFRTSTIRRTAKIVRLTPRGVLALRRDRVSGDRMNWIANVLVTLVALLHAYFLDLEMFLWTKPRGLKTFGMSLEKATDSAVLAANQGLYNGFLAAGLIWGLAHPTAGFGFQIKT